MSVWSLKSGAGNIVLSTETGGVVLAGSPNCPGDAPNWPTRGTWYVDPLNTTGKASNSNAGSDASAPLATMAECFARIGEGTGQAITVNLLSDMATTDRPVCRYIPNTGNTVRVIGSPTIIYTSTVTGWTSAAAAPTTTDNQLVDAAVPSGSWTAAGALVSGRVIRRTNGTVVYCHPMLDLGANTLRVSTPGTGVGTFFALAPGDTYQVLQLPIVRDIQVVGPYATSQAPSVSIITCDVKMANLTSPFFFQNCTDTVSNFGVSGCIYGNHGFNVSSNKGFLRGIGSSTSFIGACFRGTGATLFTIQGPSHGVKTVGPLFFQGARLELNNDVFMLTGTAGTTPNNGLYFYGTTDCLTALYWSFCYFFGSRLGGAGNTGQLITAARWSACAYDAVPVVAGSSSAGTPLTVGAVNFAVGALPIVMTAEQNGIFSTQ